MSSSGRLYDALDSLWFGYEDFAGNSYPGVLTDANLQYPLRGKLVRETVDLLLNLGWSERPA